MNGVSPLLKHFVKLTFGGKKGSGGCGDDDGTLLEAKGEVWWKIAHTSWGGNFILYFKLGKWKEREKE